MDTIDFVDFRFVISLLFFPVLKPPVALGAIEPGRAFPCLRDPRDALVSRVPSQHMIVARNF